MPRDRDCIAEYCTKQIVQWASECGWMPCVCVCVCVCVCGQVPRSGASNGRLKARRRCVNFVNSVKNRSLAVVGAGAERERE